MNELKKVVERLVKFRDDRDWKQFHTPESLAKSIVIESTELLENFQWGSNDVDISNVKEEIADVLAYLLLLCEEYGFEPVELLNNKIDKNELKYPIVKAFGTSKKYTKL